MPPATRRYSPRLAGYDYTQPGAYFLTICTHNRAPIFGAISSGVVHLSPCGQTVRTQWLRTGPLRPKLELDCFVVMPNHFHALVIFLDRQTEMLEPSTWYRSQKGEVGSLVAGFKAAVTRQIREQELLTGQEVWQKNYYDHVVRDAADFDRIQEYIYTNPAKWEVDRFFQ